MSDATYLHTNDAGELASPRMVSLKGVGVEHHPSRQRKLRKILRLMFLGSLDFLASTTALTLALLLMSSPELLRALATPVPITLFGMSVVAALYSSGVYRSSWRFFSLWHAATLALVSLAGAALGWVLVFLSAPVPVDMRGLYVVIVNQWLLATAFMLILRAFRRAAREHFAHPIRNSLFARKLPDRRQALLVGSAQWAMSVIDLVRAEQEPSFTVGGILLPSSADTIDWIGGVRVLGNHDMLVDVVAELEARGRRPSLVIACDDGTHLSHREMARLTHRARELGLELSLIRDCWSHILQRPTNSDPQELSVKDLLGRNEYEMDGDLIARQVEGNCVLVTGAGGTIGGELCWQLATFRPSRLVLIEHAEYQLYAVEMRLRERYPDIDIHAELCDIRESDEVKRVFARHLPSIVYHAAALKHVPIVEGNPCAGVHTNIIGTKIVADAVCEFGVRAMVQVSTDKAVNPVGMMGATKRVGELYSQALDLCGVDDADAPRFMTVRFGNVLGSSGSIVPLFKRQIAEGKPLTVTHPDIERFFMTVREAVQLILQSSASALNDNSQRGTIFVLDMGKPVRIIDLAYRMIHLYGLEPETDVPINFVGLRPGEKLYEELFDICEEQVQSGIAGIFEARSQPIPLPFITKSIQRLSQAVRDGDHLEATRITHHLAKIPSSGAQFDIFVPHGRADAESAPVTL